MIKKASMIILILIYLFTIQPELYKAFAAGETAGPTYITPINAVALTGSSPASQQSFEVEDYWIVNGAKFNLDYQASPLMQLEKSSVTLLLNGTPFYSFRPLMTDTVHQHLQIDIPKELVIKGSNTLQIEGYLQTTGGITNQMCIPTESRDKWLQIYDTSSISLNYSAEAMKTEIRDFNRHFIGRDMVSNEFNGIAVSNNNDPVELEAAVYALSGLAKANPLKDKIIPLNIYSAGTLKDKHALVFVSLFANLPDPFKKQLDAADMKESALIQLVNVGTQATLVVTSDNPDLLVKAGRLIANQALVNQLYTRSKIVTAATEVDSPQLDISRTLSLTETGDKLTGAMHREKIYFISLPGNRSIADASKISLDFSYAQNLDFDRSLVTILVNNTPIGSKKLTSALADGDSIQLPIPKNLNISGNFSVTIAFELELLNASCIQNQDQMPWAFIAKDSLLQVNTNDKADLLFNNYPYPFLRDGSFNQVAVVMPTKLDSATYQAVANLFNLLGQYAVTNLGKVQFLSDTTKADQLQNHQIIAIGTYQNNKVIRDNNAKLYFKYDSSGSTFLSNEKISIDADYGKLIGTIQLIESPYAAGHGLLAVTGVSSENINMASRLLETDSTMWKVFGDGVVTDKDLNIKAFRFKKAAIEQAPSVITEVLKRSDVLAFMIAAVLVMLLVLLSLILMIRKYRKKRRGGQ